MTRKLPKTTPMHRLMQLAARQCGVFSIVQARDLGITDQQIQGLLRKGVVRRRRPGVYGVVGSVTSHEQAVMSAILAAPDGAVASHQSAAYLHGLCVPPSVVNITVGPDQRVRQEQVVAHRSLVTPSHRAVIGAIPVTSLHRTVVDLASVTDLDSFAGVLDPLLTEDRVQPDRLLRTLDDIVRAPGRHGTALLRTALDVWLRPIEPGSPAEARLLRRLLERGFEGFEAQHEVVVEGRPYRLDVAWADRRCALEYAGAEFHGPRIWPRDEARMAALRRAGWDICEVDAVDILPSRTRLWEWLDARFRRAA